MGLNQMRAAVVVYTQSSNEVARQTHIKYSTINSCVSGVAIVVYSLRAALGVGHGRCLPRSQDTKSIIVELTRNESDRLPNTHGDRIKIQREDLTAGGT